MESGRRYLDTGAAAAYVGLSPDTLNRMRVEGAGPRYAKLGRRVVYALHRLDLWMEARERHSRRTRRHPGDDRDCSGPNATASWRRYLDTEAAAARVGLSPGKLNRMRVEGCGPRYAKKGRRVLYDVHDLDAWIDAHERRFTGEAGGQ